MMRMTCIQCIVACVVAVANGAEAPVTGGSGAGKEISFNRDIRPLLSDRCFRCHGPDAGHREADLRLDRRDDAIAEREGSRPIAPGKPAESTIYHRITATDEGRMPPPDSNLSLAPSEIELLRQWIEQGARYEPHWSFIPPKSPAVPKVRQETWPRNPIDNFVLAKLEERKLSPAPEASKEALLRRATLALTGLPPTLSEMDAFLADNSPDAYQRVVDRLLASPSYGERMALEWLDAARYADTNGYYNDSERQAWPWRDWVINAYNANKPFDRFTIEQLAGDLLPQPSLEQQIATGFNRNHMVTNETGIIDEEYRIGYVVDRVDTTTTVWLGLSMGCARCHDHKYDPISQREYYEFLAYFNTIEEKGLVKDVTPLSPPPTVSLPTPEQTSRLAELRGQRTRCDAQLEAEWSKLKQTVAGWEPTCLSEVSPTPAGGLLTSFDFEQDGEDHGPHPAETTLFGKLDFVRGVKGRASQFDATQYVEFNTAEPFELSGAFSLSIWIKPGGAPSGCVISKMDASAESRGFEIIWYKSQPRINLVHAWGRNSIEVVAAKKFSGNQWRHLAIVYDGTGKAAGMKVYIDGVLSEVDVRRDNLSGSVATAEPWRIAWKGTGVGFEGGVDELKLYERPLTADEISTLYWRDLLEGAIATPVAQRTRQQVNEIKSFYITRHGSVELRRLALESSRLLEEANAVQKSILFASVMKEMENPRSTFVLTRGQYDQPAQPVNPGVPVALGALVNDTKRNRLGLAEWLVSPANPLTARVAVNRYWQQTFGDGLVRTMNDFGLQGEQPTHPELLDWLAVHFMASGWDVKGLMKLLVTSAAFRQSSNLTPELAANDPENRLLARGPRFRLPAELIRDQALKLSGLLVDRIGGPSVKPYQPAGLWEAVSYNGDQTYEADHGDSLYRRGLYTYWKRQSPPPGILAFDGPTREICTVSRARTNTPTQALVLLNDVTYVEAARNLAARILAAQSESNARIAFGFRSATGRLPNAVEAGALQSMVTQQLAAFRERPEAAKALLRSGESPVDPSLEPCELAAWTMVANVLLNLDEVITQH